MIGEIKMENKGGRGFGELDETDLEFLKPNFDRKAQMGRERAVGQVAQVGDLDKQKQRVEAQLEGDDLE